MEMDTGSFLTIPPEGMDGQTKCDSPRHRRLMQEAEMRAEQQAAARSTMLELAQALEDLRAQQQNLLRRLQLEQQTSAGLRSKCDSLERQLEDALADEEKRQAERLVENGLKSGNKLFFGMLLEKSREAYDVNFFTHDGGEPTEEDGDEGAAGTEAATPAGGETNIKLAREDVLRSFAVGDGVTFKWIFKLWMHEVQKTKQKVAEEGAARERQRLEEERERRIQQEIEARVGEERKMAVELERRVKAANDIIKQHEKTHKQLEEQLEKNAARAAERERQLLAFHDKLQTELSQSERLLKETQGQLQALQQKHTELEERLRRTEADSQAEKTRLREAIRSINSELEQAVILARHMRETALKAKRDAAQSVSPEKFAQLVAELEDMRDKMSALGRQYDSEKTNSLSLRQKLDKNQRRLELERQFLPLLHKARGPLGPKTSVGDSTRKKENQSWDLTGTLPVASGANTSDKKLHASQSAGSLLGRNATMGGPLGGPLGGP